MNLIKLSFIILIISLFYIVNINILSSILAYKPLSTEQQQEDFSIDNFNTQLPISDSISVSIKRTRFYGTIYESLSESGKTSKLYLADFIPIPLFIKGYSMLLFHMIFIIGVIGSVSYLFYLEKIERRNIEHETMG